MEDFEINDYNDNLYCLEKENKLIKHEMFHKYMDEKKIIYFQITMLNMIINYANINQ